MVIVWDVLEEVFVIVGENNWELKVGVYFEKMDVLFVEFVGDD